jgi:uncharacterized membrane protein
MEPGTAKSILVATIALGAIFGIISATTDTTGWLWTVVRALDGTVFVAALVVFLVTSRNARRSTR